MVGTNRIDRIDKVGITLPRSLLNRLDKVRRDIPRSTYIRRAVEQYMGKSGGTKWTLPIITHFLFVLGYAIKQVIKIAAVVVGLFIGALAYLQYQGIIHVDWSKLEAISQGGLTTVANMIMNLGASHTAVTFYDLIPLTSSASAGLTLGLTRG